MEKFSRGHRGGTRNTESFGCSCYCLFLRTSRHQLIIISSSPPPLTIRVIIMKHAPTNTAISCLDNTSETIATQKYLSLSRVQQISQRHILYNIRIMKKKKNKSGQTIWRAREAWDMYDVTQWVFFFFFSSKRSILPQHLIMFINFVFTIF